MKKATIFVVTLCAAAALAACGESASELPKYKQAETLADSQITKDANPPEENTTLSGKNPYRLDPDFIIKNLGEDRFASNKAYVNYMVSITENTGDMTKQEAELWHQLILQQEFSANLIGKTAEKSKEINAAMDALAKQKMKTKEDLLKDYQMTEKQFNDFVKKQSEKYLAANVPKQTDTTQPAPKTSVSEPSADAEPEGK